MKAETDAPIATWLTWRTKQYTIPTKTSDLHAKTFPSQFSINHISSPMRGELQRQFAAIVEAVGTTDGEGFMAALLSAIREIMPGLQMADPRQEYTSAEVEALQRGGADLSVGMDTVNRVAARTAVKYAHLYATSHSVEQIARGMGVTNGRVRQLLGARQLYGFKMHGAWLLPDFQFYDGRPIPGIEHVFPRLAPNLSPIAVYNWFTRPDPDLADDDGPPMSPRAWLLTGHSAQPVATLAAAL